uniref:Uncharacterized protein n=1 Tax=Desertifilum tharense IPPAS B-1220 TaxID=1781255 RepID=A0ACD5GRR7_9CYAN
MGVGEEGGWELGVGSWGRRELGVGEEGGWELGVGGWGRRELGVGSWDAVICVNVTRDSGRRTKIHSSPVDSDDEVNVQSYRQKRFKFPANLSTVALAETSSITATFGCLGCRSYLN